MDLIRAYASGLLPDFNLRRTELHPDAYNPSKMCAELTTEVGNNFSSGEYAWFIEWSSWSGYLSARDVCQELLRRYEDQQLLQDSTQ